MKELITQTHTHTRARIHTHTHKIKIEDEQIRNTLRKKENKKKRKKRRRKKKEVILRDILCVCVCAGCADGSFLYHLYRKPKRIRTAFSPSQLLRLEQAFDNNHYVVGQERKELASKLSLSETQVSCTSCGIVPLLLCAQYS